MTRFKPVQNQRNLRTLATAAVVASLAWPVTDANAQTMADGRAGADNRPVESGQSFKASLEEAGREPERAGTGAPLEPIATPWLNLRHSSSLAKATTAQTRPAASHARFSSSHKVVAHRVAGGMLGGLAGFALGGAIGARLEGQCRCDDPGLQGFVIGAPIGAAILGVLGALYY